MKFGENLYYRSVPQWAPYNVEYNELKELIKLRTTRGLAQPVVIPGQGNPEDAWQALEDELFPILCQQYDRVNLFVRSKYGEIDRRLISLQRQIGNTKPSQAEAEEGRPIEQTRKYQRLLDNADAIGSDIQALSQFAGAQRLAFKKILKKYAKWTGSHGLRMRMENEVLGKPTNLLNLNFAPPLERLEDISEALERMRNPAPGRMGARDDSRLSVAPKSTAWRIYQAAQDPVSLRLDAALSSVPFGVSAGRACYWIHPDNLEEARVLLLRFMKYTGRKRSLLSHRGSLTSLTSPNLGSGRNLVPPLVPSRTHIAMFDNLQRLVQEQSSSTISQSEDAEGAVPSKVALTCRWNDGPDGVVTVVDLSPSQRLPRKGPQLIQIKRDDLPRALLRESSATSKKPDRPSEGVNLAQEFLSLHRDIKPLAELHTDRLRFAGINNSLEVGTWALLDTNIVMTPFAHVSLGSTDLIEPSPERDKGASFPHAVLDIRWEFSHVPEVVRAFDHTHLAERVRGFTLEAHAVYVVCQPAAAPPFWQPLLQKDIRKFPLAPSRHRRRRRELPQAPSGPSSTARSSESSSVAGLSDTMFSSTAARSSVTSMPRSSPSVSDGSSSTAKKPKLGPSRKKKKKTQPAGTDDQIAPQRYWNEFDDSESILQRDDGYAIYVNPDEPMNFPGKETLARAWSVTWKTLTGSKERVVSWLSTLSPTKARARGRGKGKSKVLCSGERRPLLRSDPFSTSNESGTSESETDTATRNIRASISAGRVRSGSLATRPRAVSVSLQQGRFMTRTQRSHERVLFRLYCGLIALSYVLVVLSAVLASSGRRKAVVEVDSGVICGIVAAVCCDMFSIVLMRSRRQIPALGHRLAVWLAVGVNILAGIVVLTYLAMKRLR